MTISIDRATRERASMPPMPNPEPMAEGGNRAGRPNHLILAVRIFAGAAAAAGVALGAVDLAADGGVHLVVPAVGCLLLAGLAAAVLVLQAILTDLHADLHAELADRQEFYRRGQLDGWMKGWRGTEPDVDDPLFH